MRMLEKYRNQHLDQFLEKVNREVPVVENSSLKERYNKQFISMVHLSFSANILHRGLRHANRLYNHIVKIEYKCICQFIFQLELESRVREELLNTLKRTRKQLLVASPKRQKSEGLIIFYTLVGGNRLKYRDNRQSIIKMYQLIKQESNRYKRMHSKESYKNKRVEIRKVYNYKIWRIKSFLWQ